MPIGNPVTLTSNVASKTISVTATASQTLFNVTGGYRINSLGVFKNGLRLQDGVDYTARDGLTVTLLSAASGGDKLQFVVFDTFRVAEAIRPAVDEQTIRGNLNVVGILSCLNLEGPVSLNITSGIQTFHDVRVGGALTVAGSLTYEDTTNTNTTGIATFSGGMNISGVGATATTLNVTGVATVGNNISIGDSIFHTGDSGGTTFGFPAADTFTVYTNGSERVRVDSSGRFLVGTKTAGAFTNRRATIATTSGTTGLELRSATDGDSRIVFTDSTDSSDSGSYKGQILYDQTSDYMSFNTNGNNERLRITSAGDVGIGDNAPDNSYGTNLSVHSTATDGARLKISDGTTGKGNTDGLDIISTGSVAYFINRENADMAFSTNNSEAFRVDSGQRLLVGTTSDTAPGGFNAKIQTASTSYDGSISLRRDSDNTGAQSLVFGKSRGSLNGNTIVQSGDTLGTIDFYGADGTDLNTAAAQIYAQVDGTPGSNDMPGRLVFTTTADGASSTTERARIDSSGRVLIGSGAISSPKSSDGGFDVCSHNLSIVFGGSSLSGTTPLRANNATKDGRIAASHYTNSEEPVGVVRVISNSTENQVYWGGGSSIINAATDHRFYTASTNTTTGGTERFRILAGGQVNVAGNFTQTTYTMQVTGTLNVTSNITQNGNALATNGKAIAMALIFG